MIKYITLPYILAIQTKIVNIFKPHNIQYAEKIKVNVQKS